jgi:hypothetical protein
MRQREKAAEIEIVREDDEFVPRRLPHDPLVRRVRRTYSGPMDRLKTLVAECPHSSAIRLGLHARPFLFYSNGATPVLHLGKTTGTKTDIQMQKAIYVTCTVSQGVFESEFYVTVNDSSVYASTLPSTSSPF